MTQSEIERLRHDRDFWKRLQHKTMSMDRLKAEMMEEMLHDAVMQLRGMLSHEFDIEAPGCETCNEAKEFIYLYDITWGREYADHAGNR